MIIRSIGFTGISSRVVGALICAVLANCTALGPSDEQAAGKGPDLVVVSPTVSDSAPEAGATFTLSVTVRNGGDGSSAGTALRYYRSADVTITTSDAEVGTTAIGVLAPSASSSESVELTAPATPGTYYYGACVEAVTDESDTTNNCSASVEVTVPEPAPEPEPERHPDLMVTLPSVSDTGPAAGATFTLSATVRNGGDGSAEATVLRYYRSADATITRSDAEVGVTGIGALAASASSSESVELTAPATPGTYYYGACVEAVTDESDTTNNCSASVEVTVPEPAPEPEPERHPDLMVTLPSVSDTGPAVGAAFTLSATVRNGGDGPAEATMLRYYRSADATITRSDAEVAVTGIGALAASASSSESVELTAPATPGTYYYGACADAVTDESDTTNNCSTSVEVGVQVTVPEPQGQPDLVVGPPSVSDSAPEAGATFTLSAMVRNDGEGTSSATTLRYYRSTDATVTTSDTEVGTDAIAELVAAESTDQAVDMTAPVTAGTYYYGACVDAVADESDTTNNCSSSVQVTVREPPADLVVAALTVSESSPDAGATFTLSAEVRNDGGVSTAATTLRYYLSNDATIETSDTEVGTDDVPALAPSGTSTQSMSLTAPSTAGTYYYGACVDVATDESDTTNNCSTSAMVTVLAAQQPTPSRPDLVVLGVFLASGDLDGSPGRSFTLRSSLRNHGDGESAATTLRFYRSRNPTITTADVSVGTVEVGAIAASGGTSSVLELALTAPSTAGWYYYGVCVEAVTGESDTTNNCSLALTVTVDGPPPDLIVHAPGVADNSREPGEMFWLLMTVQNQGDGGAAATTVRYYRSTDATITRSDTAVGTDEVNTLFRLQGYGASIRLTAPSTADTYYYGGCVDAVPRESDTTNNCSTSVAVTVAEPKPDLVVDSPSVSDSTPEAGAAFTLSATVENEGNGAAAAATLRYYRSADATVTTSDTEVATDTIDALAAAASSEQSVELTAPDTAGHVLLRSVRGRGHG